MEIPPSGLHALNTIAAATPPDAAAGIQQLAEAIQAHLPDLDPELIGYVMLTAFGAIAAVAQEAGEFPGPCGKYLHIGGAVAAALAAPERAV
ncbi:hypothetical protein ACQEU6_08865 [Spirillospora sp. CA-108201]